MMNMNSLRKFHQKNMLSSLLIVGLSLPAAAQAQSNNAHHEDYRAALNTVVQSEAKIANAMQQVQSGQVAHYDFLQYEHIELIRHSRALAWPPSNLAQADKEALQQEAHALLDSAQSLEWVISDYLRAFAQVRSATANTLDIAEQAALSANSTLQSSLEALQVQTLLYMASAYQGDWESLAQAFDTVLSSDIPEQTQTELLFQKERLALFAPQLQSQMQALLDSEVDEQAAHLKARYEAAI